MMRGQTSASNAHFSACYVALREMRGSSLVDLGCSTVAAGNRFFFSDHYRQIMEPLPPDRCKVPAILCSMDCTTNIAW